MSYIIIVAIRFVWSCLRDIIRFAFCHLFDCSEKVSTNIYISCKSNLRIFFLEKKNRKETINIIVGSCAFRSVNQDSKMDNRNDAKSAMNAIFGAIDDEIPLFYSQLYYTRCSELWRRSIVVNLDKGNEFRLFVNQ